MSATTSVTTYVAPFKFDIEIAISAVVAGLIIGLMNKAFNANRLIKLFIGGILFLYAPISGYGAYLKLAGIAIIADELYAILKEHVVIQTVNS